MWMDVYLDPDRPRHTSALLYDQIRRAVESGGLQPGDRLPTSRWLADDLGVSRSTVTTVYGRLVAEGVLEARVGDGTFVAPSMTPIDRRARRDNEVKVRRSPPVARPSLSTIAPEGSIVDLRSGRPDPALFPVADWRRAVRDATELAPPGYGAPAGIDELRSALASWVSRSRGLAASPSSVLVTSGAQHAVSLCARSLVSEGGVVAFEEPGYGPARRAFIDHGAQIQPVPVDAEGIVVDAIDTAAELVFVTPSHQSPTGVTLSAARRQALIEFAYRHDVVIVEDDYDTEFRYVDRPLEPLYRLDPAGRVIYVGSFSKTLSPSLRIGYVVAPPPVIEALTAARAVNDVQPPHLPQAALANLIVGGAYERHLRRVRPIYAARHASIQRWLAEVSDEGLIHRWQRSNAGLHVAVSLPGSATSAQRLVNELAEHGVVLTTMDDSWYGPSQPGVIIGFGLADVETIEATCDLITKCLRVAAGDRHN